MTFTLQSIAASIRRLLDGRCHNDWLAVAARMERDALLKWLDTSEEGLSDREAEERLAVICRPAKSEMKATVLRRDKKSCVPSDVAAVFSVQFVDPGPQKREIPAAALAPGDVILLEEGSVVPVDARLLSCDDFQVDQFDSCGKSVRVRKHAGMGEGASLLDFPNLVIAGTKVASGAALAVVVSVGPVPKRDVVHKESCNLSAYGSLVPQR